MTILNFPGSDHVLIENEYVFFLKINEYVFSQKKEYVFSQKKELSEITLMLTAKHTAKQPAELPNSQT
jgi:hypothetical protein